MNKYIWHVALGEGAKRGYRMPRDHLSDEQIDAWRGHINEALASGDETPIPGMPGYAATARTVAGALLCTVGRVDDKTPLCTFSVVTKSSQAVKLWCALHQGYPQFAGSMDDAPYAPYCAVRAEDGLPYDQGAAQWLDAYQIAVAWAWLTGRRADA